MGYCAGTIQAPEIHGEWDYPWDQRLLGLWIVQDPAICGTWKNSFSRSQRLMSLRESWIVTAPAIGGNWSNPLVYQPQNSDWLKREPRG